MIAGLVEILIFQGIGETISRFLVPLIPGPVVGLVLLLVWLQWRKGVPDPVELVAAALTRHLGLLFVPAAVGVVMFWPHLKSNAIAILCSLVASVVLTIAVSAIVLRVSSRGRDDES